MLGIKIEESACVFGDNLGMMLNASTPSSTLKKKHLGPCHHWCREANAAGIVNHFHIGAHCNGSDFLTKALGGVKHHNCADMFLHEMMLEIHGPRIRPREADLNVVRSSKSNDEGQTKTPKNGGLSKSNAKTRAKMSNRNSTRKGRNEKKPNKNPKGSNRNFAKANHGTKLNHNQKKNDNVGCRHERHNANGICQCKHPDPSCKKLCNLKK